MSVDEKARRRDWLARGSIAAVALLSWGAILLVPDAMYWDDWVAMSDPVGLYHDLGLPWMGPVVQALFALGPWSFKVLGLVSVVVVGWAAYLIADRGLSLTRLERWLVAALIVALPLNTIRVSLAVILTYSASLALFMIAWWLLVAKSPDAPGRARYVVAALLFFASFSTASLLLFVVVPVAHLFLLAAQQWGWSWRTLGRMIARFWYLGAAPVAFWVIRALFFPPTALYVDYNTFISLSPPFGFEVRATALLVVMVAVTLVVVVLWRWRRRIASGRTSAYVALVLAAACGGVAVLMLWLWLKLAGPMSSPWIAVTSLLFACALVLAVQAIRALFSVELARRADGVVAITASGLIMVALGALPYLVVGKIPTFVEWDVRHQLLLPFGVAVLAVATWRSLAVGGPRRVVAALVVSAFALVSLSITLTLVADWHKQEAVVAALRASDEVKGVTTVVFTDQTRALNFSQRAYSSYEYHGWLALAFGDKTRLGVDGMQVGEFLDSDPDVLEALGERYGHPDYVYSTDAVLVDIRQVPGSTWWDLLLGGHVIELAVTKVDDLEELR